jgi:thioredoxin reductase
MNATATELATYWACPFLHDVACRRREPLPFESSHPGLFAVGDVRAGSMKRVASAVGEGSAAVRSVHEHLAFHG